MLENITDSERSTRTLPNGTDERSAFDGYASFSSSTESTQLNGHKKSLHRVRSKDMDDGTHQQRRVSLYPFEKSADDRKLSEDNLSTGSETKETILSVIRNETTTHTSSSNFTKKIKEKLSFVPKWVSVRTRETFNPVSRYPSSFGSFSIDREQEDFNDTDTKLWTSVMNEENVSVWKSEVFLPIQRFDSVDTLFSSSTDSQMHTSGHELPLDYHSRHMSPFSPLSPQSPGSLSKVPSIRTSKQSSVYSDIVQEIANDERTDDGLADGIASLQLSEGGIRILDGVQLGGSDLPEGAYTNSTELEIRTEKSTRQQKQKSPPSGTRHEPIIDSSQDNDLEIISYEVTATSGHGNVHSRNEEEEAVGFEAFKSEETSQYSDPISITSQFFESKMPRVEDSSSHYTTSSVTSPSTLDLAKYSDDDKSLAASQGKKENDTDNQLPPSASSMDDDNEEQAKEQTKENDSVTANHIKPEVEVNTQKTLSRILSRKLRIRKLKKEILQCPQNINQLQLETSPPVEINLDSPEEESPRTGSYFMSMSPLQVPQLARLFGMSSPARKNELEKALKVNEPEDVPKKREKPEVCELQIASIYTNSKGQGTPDRLTPQANPMSMKHQPSSAAGMPALKKMRSLLGDWSYRSIYKSITNSNDFPDKSGAKRGTRKPLDQMSEHSSNKSSSDLHQWTSEALSGFDKNLVKQAQAKKLNLAAREDLKNVKLTIERLTIHEHLAAKVEKKLPLSNDESVEFDLICSEYVKHERVKNFIANEKNTKVYSPTEKVELHAMRLELERMIKFDAIFRKEKNNEAFSFEEKAEYLLLREIFQVEQQLIHLYEKYKPPKHGIYEEVHIPPQEAIDLILMRIEREKHARYDQLISKEKLGKGSYTPQKGAVSTKLTLLEKSELAILRKEIELQRKQHSEKVQQLSNLLRNGIVSVSTTPSRKLPPPFGGDRPVEDTAKDKSSPPNRSTARKKTSSSPRTANTSSKKMSNRHSEPVLGCQKSSDQVDSSSTSFSELGSKSNSTDSQPNLRRTRGTSSSPRLLPSPAPKPHYIPLKQPTVSRHRVTLSTSSPLGRPSLPFQSILDSSPRQNMSDMVLSEFISPLRHSSPKDQRIQDLPNSLEEEAVAVGTEAPASEKASLEMDALTTSPFQYHDKKQSNGNKNLALRKENTDKKVSTTTGTAIAWNSSGNVDSGRRTPNSRLQEPHISAQSPLQSEHRRRLSFSKMVELNVMQLKIDKDTELAKEKQRRLSDFLKKNINHNSTVADSILPNHQDANGILMRKMSLQQDNAS